MGDEALPKDVACESNGPLLGSWQMRIVQVTNERLPAVKYGGTPRVVWWLSKKLAALGHKLTIVCLPGSNCDFADIVPFDAHQSINHLIPDDCDVIHLHCDVNQELSKPYLKTHHWPVVPTDEFKPNTVFISAAQAKKCGSDVFVHHGLDLDAYGRPDFESRKEHLIFLAKAAWKVKNVRGAISIARRARRKLAVAGGHRINFNMGFRLTLDPMVRFCGMVDDNEKRQLLNRSQALLFPVLWNEPFGLALIESLYYGNPVFGTPFGSLPEIVTPEVGYLSPSEEALVDRLATLEADYSRRRCHAYACDMFSSTQMANEYLRLYEQVASGRSLHAVPPKMTGGTDPPLLPMAA